MGEFAELPQRPQIGTLENKVKMARDVIFTSPSLNKDDLKQLVGIFMRNVLDSIKSHLVQDIGKRYSSWSNPQRDHFNRVAPHISAAMSSA